MYSVRRHASDLQKLLKGIHIPHQWKDALDRKTVCMLTGLVGVIFWLYYELAYVAPVCPYFTGHELPPHLNKFNTIGKTYRPSFYMFTAYFQWMYLICFGRLMMLRDWLQVLAVESHSRIVAIGYKIGVEIVKLVFQCFLFSKMYRNQAVVALREMVEAHNDAVVVLDYYLPKWVGNYCRTCGKFTSVLPEGNKLKFSRAQTQGGFNTVIDEGKDGSSRSNPGYMDNHMMSDNRNLGFELNIRPSGNSVHTENNFSLDKDAISSNQMDGVNMNGKDKSVDDTVTGMQSPTSFHINSMDYAEIPPRKVLRGVMVIIGDLAVPYSICSQPMACRCGTKVEERGDDACNGCVRSVKCDTYGLNLGPPSLVTIRYLIADAVEMGYACVQVHLNVNLGMASEAFPTWTGLRCFPLSLYSNAMLDLDAALNKISSRYPNLPLNCVGFGYGSNILMEYMAIGSSGKAIQVESEHMRSSQRNPGFVQEPKRAQQKREQPVELAEVHEEKTEEGLAKGSSKDSTPSRVVSFGRGIRSMMEPKSSDEFMNAIESKPNMRRILMPAGKQVVMEWDDPNYESFNHLSKVMEEVASVKGSVEEGPNGTDKSNVIVNPNESHFQIKEENEECTYETRLAYPPAPPTEVFLNTSKISAAVCVNLNLRPEGNVLYKNAAQRRVNRRSFFGRYCYAALRYHLINLLREVHCRRANDNAQKECQHYRCCHFAKMEKPHWLKNMLYRIRDFAEGFERVTRYDGIEQLILDIHREYCQSYRYMRRKGSGSYINYGSNIYKRFGARAAADFKFAALMTLRYVYTNMGQDDRSPIETLAGPPEYKLVNRRIKTSLRLGRTHLNSAISNVLNHAARRQQDPNILKYVANLINNEYTKNVVNIRRNFTSIKIPTLLINSLDNSLCTLEDIDVLDVIRNPNIVYYVAKSGGYSTFITGTYPTAWLSMPIMEFLDEMTSRRVVINGVI